MIKIKFHSIVDVITNSSTVIYTYQNSVDEAKDLVAEMLKLVGVDKKPDDIFYYGVFCDNDRYLEDNDNLPDNFPTYNWNDSDAKEKQTLQESLLNDIKLSIMKGEEKPDWMSSLEIDDDYGWNPNSYLHLIPKDEKYKVFGEKIKALLGSISADGGRDG